MVEIPIKIKKTAAVPNNALRSGTGPLNAPPKRPTAKSTKPKIKWLLWLLGAALLAESAWLGYFFVANKTDAYKKLLPPKNLAVIYFEPSEAIKNFKTLKDSGYAWPPFLWAADFINGLTQNTDINQLGSQITLAFEDKMALVLLSNTPAEPKWLFFSRARLSPADFARELEKAQDGLKFKYNLITEVYRQAKIIRVKHLNQNPRDVYFAYLKNYLIISNDQTALKETINKILDF